LIVGSHAPAPHISPSSAYFESLEARLVYRILHGVKHFGYFPEGQERLAIRKAQRLMVDQVADALALTPGMRVLDAGCGEGEAALQLARSRGVQMIGVDLLPWNVRRARRRAKRLGLQERARFEVMDYCSLDLPDGSVDAAYTLESLVHPPRPERALAELHRVLKPGGRLALFEYTLIAPEMMTPHQRSLAEYVVRGTGMEGLRQFTPGTLGRLLSDTGFHDVAERDLTPRILPMVHRFYRRFWLPYQIVRLIGLRDRAVTIAAVVEAYPHVLAGGAWQYVAVTGRKPGPENVR
jgi:ubiquinone/menaquinone biosynthesis C-methylase UbiE